jgi:hypothetical protein
MECWWTEPLRRAVAGRRVVLAGAKAAYWTEHVDLLRRVGAEEFLVIATEGRGAGSVPDVPTVVVDPPSGSSVMEQIHAADRTLAEPPTPILDALHEFDPQRDALVVGTFLSTVTHLDGRPLLASRRPKWVALEDKVVVDSFWDRAGVERQPFAVVALADAERAASRLDRGDGTVWAADARDGFHGGAHGTVWVADGPSRTAALRRLAPMCERVRVMPFVEGIPCSIHGIVLPDGVAVLRPVEMVTLRRGHDLVYSGCATYWDPPTDVREQMRSIARSVGHQLAREVGFRGAFTVDGVAADDGFWPTELNPRFGAGIMTIARGTGIPMVLLNDLIVAGHDIGRTASEVERDVVTAGDAQRGGGTWRAGLEVDADVVARAARFDGSAWSWTESDGAAAGQVTAGVDFVRCVYDQASTPIGPSTGPRAAAFWNFAAEEFGADIGGLTAARDDGRA